MCGIGLRRSCKKFRECMGRNHVGIFTSKSSVGLACAYIRTFVKRG